MKGYKRFLNVILDIAMLAVFYLVFTQGDAVSVYALNLLVFVYGLQAFIGCVLFFMTGDAEDDAVKKISKTTSLPSVYRHGVLTIELLCLGALGWFWIAGFYFFGALRIESLRKKANEYKKTGKLPNDDSKKSDESES